MTIWTVNRLWAHQRPRNERTVVWIPKVILDKMNPLLTHNISNSQHNGWVTVLFTCRLWTSPPPLQPANETESCLWNPTVPSHFLRVDFCLTDFLSPMPPSQAYTRTRTRLTLNTIEPSPSFPHSTSVMVFLLSVSVSPRRDVPASVLGHAEHEHTALGGKKKEKRLHCVRYPQTTGSQWDCPESIKLLRAKDKVHLSRKWIDALEESVYSSLSLFCLTDVFPTALKRKHE